MKYLTPVSIVLVIVLITVSILAPEWANVIAGVVVVIGLLMVMYAVVQKHIQRRQSQTVNKLTTARNIFIEIMGLLLAMLFAGLLGRYAAEVFTRQISSELTKLVVGIVIGTLIGLGTGFPVHQAWGRLIRIVS